MLAPLVCALTGFILGILQSLFAGIYARSWSGGTGILWGIICGVVSLVAAIFLSWKGAYVAVLLPAGLGVLTALSIRRDRERPGGKGDLY